MKANRFLAAMLACASLCACSDDASTGIAASQEETASSGVAYMAVRLSGVGSSGTKATEEAFANGSAAEYAVQNAYFYFYGADGVFVTEANVWNGGEKVEGNDNVEFEANTVVALKGLTGNAYPEYVVTVLNRPDGFEAPKTLKLMQEALADASGETEGITDGSDYFVMSTASYVADPALDYPFVTQLAEENFSKEPISDDLTSITPVTVYVERLAAKVAVDVSATLGSVELGDGNSTKAYAVTTTVAGMDNAGAGNVASETLYVKLEGWKLNAKAKSSNIVKDIDDGKTWTAAGLGFTWNDAAYYRSYWGKSFNYGGDYAYPGSYAEYEDGYEETGCLAYVNLQEPTALGAYEYCAENTNTSAIVTDNFPSAVTSVLLSATLCDIEGNALDMVRYNGMLFTKDHYLAYVLNVADTNGDLNAYTKGTDGSYSQLGTSNVELKNLSDGKVAVALTSATEEATLYSYSTTTGKWEEITDKTSLSNALADASDGAVGYNGGAMYYNIPIEHLNNAAIAEDGTIPEAKYGVVRNHCYQLTITKLESIGKGIFDPDEPILPNDDEQEMYYVGAQINILSWKIVSQDVQL